ncbi:hypothetical protein HanPI659440_Chr01g0008171 [Helianthus annuus]|nr:hypothetical protein HanPI659440_Chr01g0008171 [Helianthus annuus]
MCNAHEGKIVFSPYSLKIHIKEKKIIYHNKTLFFPKSIPFQNHNFSSTTCNNSHLISTIFQSPLITCNNMHIVDGLRDSVLGFSVNVPGTTTKDVMDMVLVTHYFDTMKEIGAASKSYAVFIPHGPGAVRDVATQIRDGLLQGSAAAS